jgi:hypothetical protein
MNTAIVASVSLLLGVQGLSAQQVRARIVDDVSRQPLAGVTVGLIGSANAEQASAMTGDDGFFEFERPDPGAYTLVIEHMGYEPLRQPLVITAGADVTIPAIILRSTAVVLDTLHAEARAADRLRGPDLTHVVYGAHMARLEQANVSGPGVVRQLGAGLRVKETGARSVCVESIRRYMSMRDMLRGSRGCEMVVVVLDGVVVGNGSHILGGMQIGHYESIEYVPPVQAGQRFGMEASAKGAIVLWTRGFGPHRSAARDPDRS